MISSSTDVAIVGGGVTGCFLAYQLAKRGVRATVLEKTTFGAGASGASAGMISPLWHIDPGVPAMFRLGLRSLELFPTVAAELSEAGMDPEFQQAGLLKVAFNEDEAEELQAGLEWQQGLQMDLEWLNTDDVLRREPEVNPAVLGGVFSPHEGNVRGQRLVDSLVHAASRLRADFRQGVEVTGLMREGSRVTGVETTDGSIIAGQVVLAAGPWTGIEGKWLGSNSGIDIPVRPVHGERVLLRKPGFLPRCPVRNFEAYVVPQVDGDISVAATRTEGRFDEQVTAGGIASMIFEAAWTFPTLAEAEVVSARAGVRPATPDGIPVLGPVPEFEGLSVAAGHDAVGIMLSPGTAELMCQYILDGNTAPLKPFSISRFG